MNHCLCVVELPKTQLIPKQPKKNIENIVNMIFIDHKAGEIIRLVASVRPSVNPLGFAKYSKKSNETQNQVHS